jgi:hypothetical protein
MATIAILCDFRKIGRRTDPSNVPGNSTLRRDSSDQESIQFFAALSPDTIVAAVHPTWIFTYV